MTRLLSLAAFACLLSPAQPLELGVYGGQSRLSRAALGSIANTPDAPSDYSLDGGFRLGFRVTTNSDTYFGHEFGYGYSRTQLVFDSAGAQRQGSPWRTGGAGAARSRQPLRVRCTPCGAPNLTLKR